MLFRSVHGRTNSVRAWMPMSGELTNFRGNLSSYTTQYYSLTSYKILSVNDALSALFNSSATITGILKNQIIVRQTHGYVIYKQDNTDKKYKISNHV